MIINFPYPRTARTRDGGTRDFDPVHDPRHRALLDRKIEEYVATHPEAAGARLETIDENEHMAVLVTGGRADRLPIKLSPAQCKDSRGVAEKVRDKYEQLYYSDDWPKYRLTEFHPNDGTAALERMGREQSYVRDVLAQKLRLNPWDIRVTGSARTSWTCAFDRVKHLYTAADDHALREACDAIGGEGMRFRADSRADTVTLTPGEPPRFRNTHPFPFATLGSGETTPFGVWLPRSGGDDYETAFIDWTESPFVLIGGEPGSGKSVLINTIIADTIAKGYEQAYVDLANKSTDFYWCRPWCHERYWGGEGLIQGAGVLNRIARDFSEEGERGRAWRANAWQNWKDIPDWAKRKYPRLFVIVDEYTTLVDGAQTVKNIGNPEKVLPAVFEEQFHGLARHDIIKSVRTLLRTGRAEGCTLVLATQTINQQSGLGPTTRDLFGNRIAQGPNPSDSLVNGVFHDIKALAPVPASIKNDPKTSKGVGRAEIAGAQGRVFKTFWAGHDGLSDTQALAAALIDRVGVPDDVDAARFLDTLRPHGPDDPVDVDYMRYLTERIDLPYDEALASDSMLVALKDAWDESKMNFGGNDPGAANPNRGGDRMAKPTASAGSDARLMDASDLARVMEHG